MDTKSVFQLSGTIFWNCECAHRYDSFFSVKRVYQIKKTLMFR